MKYYILGVTLKLVGAIYTLETALNIETIEHRLPAYAISIILVLIGDVLENQPTEV